MEQKAYPLQNSGMYRDADIAKAENNSAYENHNIRITAREHDTLLSVTNERGTKEVALDNVIAGDLIGWNVLNNHIILFTHVSWQDKSATDRYEAFFHEQLPASRSMSLSFTFYGETGGTVIGINDFNDVETAFNEEFEYHSIPAKAALVTKESSGSYNTYLSFSFYKPLEGDVTLRVIPNHGGPHDVRTYTVTPDFIPAFSTSTDAISREKRDYIYRIDVEGDDFIMRRGNTDSGAEDGKTGEYLYRGNLGFTTDSPIESVMYYETDEIQKIYWVDGNHVMRFMNIMESVDVIDSEWDDTYFDSNRPANLNLSVAISKANDGNNRPNGIAQYIVTYLNKHGQQTGYVWASDLVYLSPLDSGGSPDGINSNSVKLVITNLDESFQYFRVYSIFRSSIDSTVTGYLVAEAKISGPEAAIIDNNTPISTEDASSFLFLGSQPVVASTMAYQDETLFLGDLKSVGRRSYNALQKAIDDLAFENASGVLTPRVGDNVFISHIVEFQHSDGSEDKKHIPYVDCSGVYPYGNQLNLTSSAITTFKGGEKYRFALQFKSKNGVNSDAFWIGDKVNTLYPEIDEENKLIKRVVAVCTIPTDILITAQQAGFSAVTLMMAETDYSKRSVIAQGIVNPTVFNTWERYQNRTHSYSSWFFRPRFSELSWKHFDPIKHSSLPSGEIQCNYWETDTPTPYYRTAKTDITSDTENYKAGDIIGGLDGIPDYDLYAIIFRLETRGTFVSRYNGGIVMLTVKLGTGLDATAFRALVTPGALISTLRNDIETEKPEWDITKESGSFSKTYKVTVSGNDREYVATVIKENISSSGTGKSSIASAYSRTERYITEDLELQSDAIMPAYQQYKDWHIANHDNREQRYRTLGDSGSTQYSSMNDAFGVTLFQEINFVSSAFDAGNRSSLHKKHLMFIDENVVTFHSPEFEQEAVLVDKTALKFRIIGAVAFTGNISEYSLEAGPAHLSGNNLYQMSFTRPNRSDTPDGLSSWPLYLENDIVQTSEQDHKFPDDPENYSNSDYDWGGGVRAYWLYPWQKSGTIQDFTDSDGKEYSKLISKTIANLRFSYGTYYNAYGDSHNIEFDPYASGGEIRQFNYTNTQLVGLHVGSIEKSYSANVEFGLSVPGTHKYPVLSSTVGYSNIDSVPGSNYKKKTNLPVVLSYNSTPHVVISLGKSKKQISVSEEVFAPNILPYTNQQEDRYVIPMETASVTEGIIPWSTDTQTPYVVQEEFLADDSWKANIQSGKRFLFVGELYKDFSETDYGGHTSSVIETMRFIPAGPQYNIDDADSLTIVGNQGDTYFQRWDCLKTVPYSKDSVNNVIDIASFMVETHINLDGRYDKQRGIDRLASIDTTQFNSINPVYSQKNNYFTSFDQSEDADLDTYRASVTWTLPKADSAMVDEWTHITLASSLKLDGDKGICRAIRRMGNTLIGFQDRGVSQILFNSRTQLSTNEGVPIEIGNSGRVDGKRYISNKHGCINKWSIVEGKAGLYFVDNINKAFCQFDGQGINDLSNQLGFGVWFRRKNNMEPWNPKDFNNFVSFYDKTHSDVYLVTGDTEGYPCLVYNEPLGRFSSFFDYAGVPMMTNVQDRFVSFRKTDANKLWLQNEGLYCNFYGTQYDFSVTYKVAPSPYSDKIWTNLEYRADAFRVLDEDGNSVVDEQDLIDGGEDGPGSGVYRSDETFDEISVWNEYQKTDNFACTPVKKFRIWRAAIPRAINTATNKHGLDRIRNPWINLKFKRSYASRNDAVNQDIMQLHDIIVKYFE